MTRMRSAYPWRRIPMYRAAVLWPREDTSMSGKIGRVWRLTVVVAVCGAVSATAAQETRSPEETVRAYLAAMKALDFEKVYDLSTQAARQGKDRTAWAAEMRYVFQLSEAKIFEFKVFPAKVAGDKAQVPNILTSQDKFLNQLAAPEYELYTLLKEEGAWKVDRQTIVDTGDLSKWFPGEG